MSNLKTPFPELSARLPKTHNSHALERFQAILPWPPKELSPNARLHWAKKARAAKTYKEACGWACKVAKLKKVDAVGLHIIVTFYPPDNRARDADNMVAAIKPAIDAISQAIGIDDSKFAFEFMKADTIPGGEVHFNIFVNPAIKAARRVA